MENARRCPLCGGPALSSGQVKNQQAKTRKSLDDLRTRSSWIMRLTSLSMGVVTLMNGYFQDRQAADFITHFVMTTSSAGSVLTELWAYTANRWWMLAASISIQAAALMFFFISTAYFADFVSSRLAMLISALPLAGALSAWYDYRGYLNIERRLKADKRI